MEELTKSMRFIITFLFFIILLGMFTSEKFTYAFLVLVLLSMAVLNADKVKDIMGGLLYGK
ncbi:MULTISPECIES: hypothetical protein [Bacillus subtilis group]|uniref:hypothetical protein n=1 Tax=Bacillus subtilis group TaxID=653685 RepID=UPI00228211BC|nr:MULTISPECIES: hypothetical protein [Bacillus subtilis group]MCY8467197.1 hypothetical protein [Bacillus atrophaeus]MCY8475381.1 hypothetical protein [Bacillus halotolerans]MCY8479749.1 hypothetical protein [Bacillus atrophaeus]MCY8507877.1 hypothetical protein [Bacillus atrophaeus]MCY8535731.1 hypothetical protein [Bacillus vallismortis]